MVGPPLQPIAPQGQSLCYPARSMAVAGLVSPTFASRPGCDAIVLDGQFGICDTAIAWVGKSQIALCWVMVCWPSLPSRTSPTRVGTMAVGLAAHGVIRGGRFTCRGNVTSPPRLCNPWFTCICVVKVQARCGSWRPALMGSIPRLVVAWGFYCPTTPVHNPEFVGRESSSSFGNLHRC